MQFCPHCGTKLIPDTGFCPGCGTALAGLTTAPRTRRATSPAQTATPISMGPFAAIFAALMLFGAVIAYIITRQLPARENLLASAPPSQQSAPAEQNAGMPAAHPLVRLPKEALAFIQATEAKARANPTDLNSWRRLGDVTLRAAAFDPSFYVLSTEAYSHVLKAQPDDPDALRGIGNIDFDQRKYDAAIAAYEHYLAEKPDDADVRTDLGTMLLSSGAADQAVRQYQRVLETHPKFFEAQFNLGVAYEGSSPADARNAFNRALQLASDDRARNRVQQELAALASAGGIATAASAPGGIDQGNTAGDTASDATSPPANFHDAVAQAMHDLPIAGNKVQAVEWDSAGKARVLMNNFPMDQMPPFAAAKFIDDLKTGVDRAKQSFKVATPVQIDLCDAASGRVMKSVTE